MNVQEFDYDLPSELIAQQPADRRDGSRLMLVDRREGAVRHASFPDLVEALRDRRRPRPGG